MYLAKIVQQTYFFLKEISSSLFAHSAMKTSVQMSFIQQVCYHINFAY